MCLKMMFRCLRQTSQLQRQTTVLSANWSSCLPCRNILISILTSPAVFLRYERRWLVIMQRIFSLELTLLLLYFGMENPWKYSWNFFNLGRTSRHGTGLEGPHHKAGGCPEGLLTHLFPPWKHHSILRWHRPPCLREPPWDFPRKT